MKITKILNNAVVVLDDQREKIAVGAGSTKRKLKIRVYQG